MKVNPVDLCIGILAGTNTCEIATLDAAGAPERFGFPTSPMGQAALRVFLAGQNRPLRLAVSGDAAMGFAFAVGPTAQCNVYIVAPSVANHPVALARYAARSL